jgi:glutathione S-transferase
LTGEHAHLLGHSDRDKKKINQLSLDALKYWKLQFVSHKTEAMAELHALLKSKTFIATNFFSLADIFMFSLLYNVPVRKKCLN